MLDWKECTMSDGMRHDNGIYHLALESVEIPSTNSTVTIEWAGNKKK